MKIYPLLEKKKQKKRNLHHVRWPKLAETLFKIYRKISFVVVTAAAAVATHSR